MRRLDPLEPDAPRGQVQDLEARVPSPVLRRQQHRLPHTAAAAFRRRQRASPRSCPSSRRSTAVPSATNTCSIVEPGSRSCWIQDRIEAGGGRPNFSNETRLHILERLSAAEGLEKHLDCEISRHQALRPRRRRKPDPCAR